MQEYEQGHWVVSSHLILHWMHSTICRMSRGSNNALESVHSVPSIIPSLGQHLEWVIWMGCASIVW